MRISHFREFIVLSKYLNFSIASEQLNMTQSGLSRHILALEREIGGQLFDRDTHSVRLTEKGKQFLDGIQKIVAEYDSLRERVSNIAQAKLVIGVPYFGVNEYLSFVITDFEAAYPNISLSYSAAYPDEIIDGLLTGTVDVAVLPRVEFVHSDRLTFHNAFKEWLTLALNRNHPLARKKRINIRDLKDESFISLKGNYGSAILEYEYDFCRSHGFNPKIIMATDTVEAAVLKMKPDTGVMLLPRHIKEANISHNIGWVDIADQECFFYISLVHHPENQNPSLDLFVDYYLRQVKKRSALERDISQKREYAGENRLFVP